jgi:hypothetical protein
MSENRSVEFAPQPQPGHPHDLLARLYREIGISAVAAALEVSQFAEKAVEEQIAADRRFMLGEDLAA